MSKGPTESERMEQTLLVARTESLSAEQRRLRYWIMNGCFESPIYDTVYDKHDNRLLVVTSTPGPYAVS